VGYRLIVSASSPALQHRLERAGAQLLARVPEEVGAFLARTMLVFAIDARAHAAFVVGLGAAGGTPVAELVAERARQTGAPRSDDPLFLVAVSANSLSLLGTLAHEAAHCWRRDPIAAAAATPEEENAIEVETEQLAQEWLALPPRPEAVTS
jgi:hypothetical protein